MDEGVSAELRALRARAYAPGGDIADDPAAIERLAELERRDRERRAAAAREPAPAPVPESRAPDIIDAVPLLRPAPERDEAVAESDTSAADPADADEPADASYAGSGGAGARRHRPALRSVLMWAGSLVAVAVLAAGATSVVTARSASTATALPDDARVTHATTLLPTGAELPAFFGDFSEPENSRAFESFFGLAVFQTSAFTSNADDGEACIFVLRSTDLESTTSGSWSGSQGCSAGAFPAASTFIVGQEQPEELRERYPIGTALQFVLTDAGVDVFVSSAPEPGETPAARAAQPAG
ncbi:MAG: hypothetical protein PGN24_01585 [Microbacterium arborescens]